jgi:hypothetical protein
MNRFGQILMGCGGVMLLVGAVVFITGWMYAPYLFCIGSIMFAAVQFSDRYYGNDFILKRLRLQQILGALFLLITGFLMLYSEDLHLKLLANATMGSDLRGVLLALTAKNIWIATLCIAAVFELYSAFRMESRKEWLDKEKAKK